MADSCSDSSVGAEMPQELEVASRDTDSCSSSTSSSSKLGLELTNESVSNGCTCNHNATGHEAIDPVDVLFQRIVRERSLELSNLQFAMRPVTGSSVRDNLSQYFDSRTVNSETNVLSDPTDALFQRIVRERNLELSNIQFGTRPVTGSSAIDNLNQFFNRESVQQSNEGRTALEEVQGLLQQNLVTSALRRSAFRARLEESLSSRIGAPSTMTSHIVSNSPQRSSQPSGISTPVANVRNDFDNVRSDFDTASIASSDAGSEILELQRFVRAGVDLLSETIQDDIQQLHHLHVVNSALESEFRNRLERLFQDRAAQVGGGEAVQQFIHSLPSAPRPTQPSAALPSRHGHVHQEARAMPGSMTLSDRINVTGEIGSLKKQVEEMKQMLQISFELQMDTQRAIRQEVSAVFGAFMQQWMATQAGTPSAGPQIAHQSSPRPTPVVSAGTCVICLDSTIDSMLYQCGHMCVCHGCGLRLRTQGHNCPMCRAPIKEVIRAYQSQ